MLLLSMQRAHLLGISGLVLTAFALSAAENPVASVQAALKDLGFYYGNASGQVDNETRSALKRFQIRTGLQPTGEIDNQTLQALAGAPAPKPAEAAPQAPPPSLRERARQTDISDREFLDHLKASDPDKPSAATPPAQSAPPELPPTPPPRTAAPSDSAGSPSGEWTPEKAAEFVRSYLEAAEAPQPDREIAFYGERVDYFDSGRVNRKFVANDQHSYYRRWPNREFTVVGTPELVSSKGPQATVRFRMRYSVSSGRERASGATENVVQLIQENDGPKIIGIHERKIRD
jgi:peptidoglycan hydrolase-like protein with peptidoglycan-binding domain